MKIIPMTEVALKLLLLLWTVITIDSEYEAELWRPESAVVPTTGGRERQTVVLLFERTPELNEV